MRPPRAISAVVIGGICVALLVACGSADPATDASKTEPASQPVSAVVLLPGFGGGAGTVASLAAALQAAGHHVTTVSYPGDGTGDIGVMAQVLTPVVDQLRAQNVPVDLVGYSMGGLVVRAWVAQGDHAALVRRVVMLGTPNHGTSLAELGQVTGNCPQACLQMVPNSAFLASLNTGDPTPAGPAWITIRSDDDDVVRPVATVELDGASNVLLQDVCSTSSVNHSELVTNPLPLAIISRAVSQQVWQPPTASDCAMLSR